jgi:hypothetical protein
VHRVAVGCCGCWLMLKALRTANGRGGLSR